jgi:hypothetical protein
VLTNKNFAPNRAAIFTAGKRTFVALNNNKAGFQAKESLDKRGLSGRNEPEEWF